MFTKLLQRSSQAVGKGRLFSVQAQVATSPALSIHRTDRLLGAELRGVNLSEEISDETFQQIHSSWMDHCVLFVKDQSLSDEQLTRFSKRFGDLDVSPSDDFATRGGHAKMPEILVISNIKEQGKKIGSLGAGEAVWHTDMSYLDVPPQASLLHSHEIPPWTAGGHTSWLNMYAVLEDMPGELRMEIEGLWANHDNTTTSAGDLRKGSEKVVDITKAPGAKHPLIINHPETGREALFLGRRLNSYIVGKSLEESERLLDEIWEHTCQDKYVYTHKWHVGDLLIWDNRCTMHKREAFDPSQRRRMHRTQVKANGPLHEEPPF